MGLDWRALAHLLLDLHGDAVAGLLLVEGQGYPVNHGDRSFEPGMGAGLRIGVPFGRLAPWAGASVLGWLRPQGVRVAGIAESKELPRTELLLGAGLSAVVLP